MRTECFAAGFGHGIGSIGFAMDELLDGLNVSQFLQGLDVTRQIAIRYTKHGFEGIEVSLSGTVQYRHDPQPYTALERFVKILNICHRILLHAVKENHEPDTPHKVKDTEPQSPEHHSISWQT